MPSIQLFNLNRVHNVRDYGARANGRGDDGIAVNSAITQIVADDLGPTVLYFPTGIYQIERSILVPSNLAIVGAGYTSHIRVAPSTILAAAVDIFVNSDQDGGNSNIHIANLRLNANRANNATGNRMGIWFDRVSDFTLENLSVEGARADGIHLDRCSHGSLSRCRSDSNGRHGYVLSDCHGLLLMAPRAVDNCQVETAGTGDGIRLDTLTRDCVIVAPHCEDTHGGASGQLQQYGVREVTGAGTERIQVIGGAFANQTGANVSHESGTWTVLVPGLHEIPGSLVILA